MPNRLPYDESCRLLQNMKLLDPGELPKLPARPPRHDDEQPGVSFFRARIAGVVLDGLTLPRTFFGRSEVCDVSFRGSELSESTANWNDFIDVDFSEAELSGADFRCSTFSRVSFNGASLCGADLRLATFYGCNFADADMRGARLSRSPSWFFRLSRGQRAAVSWLPSGPEPEGG